MELYEGLFLLERANQQCNDRHIKEAVTLTVTDKKLQTICQLTLELPTNQEITLLVTQAMANPFGQTLSPSPKQETFGTQETTRNQFVETKEEIPVPLENQRLEDENTLNHEVPGEQPKPSITLPTLPKINKKKSLIFMGILAILIGAAFGTNMIRNQASSRSSDLPSYESLVENKKYSTALKDYPDQETNLVETLYTNSNSQALKELAENEHSQLALFYWSFLEEKWSKVTTVKDVAQNETIQAMRGFAYLKQDKLEEAQLINKALKNETLTKQINLYLKEAAYKEIHNENIAKAITINDQIKDKQLGEDITVAESIVNLLDKYAADAKNSELSEEERKEAQKNYDTWKENLAQLGGNTNDGK